MAGERDREKWWRRAETGSWGRRRWNNARPQACFGGTRKDPVEAAVGGIGEKGDGRQREVPEDTGRGPSAEQGLERDEK